MANLKTTIRIICLLLLSSLFFNSNAVAQTSPDPIGVQRLKERMQEKQEDENAPNGVSATFVDLVERIKIMVDRQECLKLKSICMGERCEIAFCQADNADNIGPSCSPQTQAYTQCIISHQKNCADLKKDHSLNPSTLTLKLAKDEFCSWVYPYEREKNKRCALYEHLFDKNLLFKNTSILEQILSNNVDCGNLEWYKKGRKNLNQWYEERQPRQDYSSSANSRPSYSTDSRPSNSTDSGSECPKRYKERVHKIDTNNNPNDKTYIDCRYFEDGALHYQTPYIEIEEGKQKCKHGLELRYGTALDGSHPIGLETHYKNCEKDGTATSYSWCQTKSQRNSKRTTRYKASISTYEDGEMKNREQLESGCKGK